MKKQTKKEISNESAKETQKLTVVQDGKEQERIVNKPSPEEVVKFKEDFDAAMKKFAETKWEISEPGSFQRNDVSLFLLDYLKNYVFWTKTGWMGVIKMEEELKKAMKETDETTGLSLDYQALEFCGYMLMNPGGTGYALAKEFEKQADKYSRIMTTVGQKVEDARKQLKNVQYLQEKWAAGEQGFYLSDLEPKEEPKEEKKEESTAVVVETEKL